MATPVDATSIKRFLIRMGDVSLNRLARKLRRWAGGAAPAIHSPSLEFLKSPEYRELMFKYVPCTGQYGRHEAQTYTLSFQHRHKTWLRTLGVFRWRGVQENLDVIIPYVTDARKVVVDFGGAGCPLGFHSIVVDRLPKDAMGRPVLYRQIRELRRPVDVVFACHVLEHIAEVDQVLRDIHDALVPGGVLIVFVPAFTNEGWRAASHMNKRFGDHAWTFGLSGTQRCAGLQNYADIDEVVGRHFSVENACYCGDDSIFLLARKTVTVNPNHDLPTASPGR